VATAGHLSIADARVMEREAEAASGSQELTAFLDQANSRPRNEELREVAAGYFCLARWLGARSLYFRESTTPALSTPMRTRS